jgi:signal peptidase II
MPPLSGRSFTWVVALVTWTTDQISKLIIMKSLVLGESVSIIPGFFDLTLVTNTGGVFGILRDLEGPLRNLLFSIIPLAAIALMVWYGWNLPHRRRWPRVALGLILGGALGNLMDRLRLGFVVDFLDAYVGRYHWPAFNLADSAICVGVAMLLVEGILFHRTDDGADPAPSPPAP